MKVLKILGSLLLAIWLLTAAVAAETEETPDDLPEEQVQASGIESVFDSLDESARDLLTRWGVDPARVFTGSGLDGGEVWRAIWEVLSSNVSNPLSAGGSAAAAILLCGLFRAMADGRTAAMNGTVQWFGSVCVAAAVLAPAGYTLAKAASATAAVGAFMLAFVPVYAGILISMGRSLTATGACSLVFTGAQVAAYLGRSLLQPLVGLFFALAVSEAAGGVKPLGLTAAVKKAATWGVGLITVLFAAIAGVTGVINGAGDSMTQRTARFFVGNIVPIIGGTLSETIGTVQGYLSVLKTGAGALGICAVLAVLLPVLVETLLWRVMLRLTESFADVFDLTPVSGMLRAIGDGFGLLIAIMVSCLLAFGGSLAILIVTGS